MAARGRYSGDGYQSYDYAYDYGHNSIGTHSLLSESWLTSYSASSSDGAKLLGSGRDSYGSRARYGVSKPNRGFASQRAQPVPLLGWRSETQGGYRANFRPLPAIRAPTWSAPQTQAATPEHSLRAFTVNSYFGGGFKQKSRKVWKDKKKQGDEVGPPVKKARASTEVEVTKSEESEGEKDGDHEEAGKSVKTEGGDKGGAGKGKIEQKPVLTQSQQEAQDKRQRNRMVERIQFVCSLCKFRTFYNEEMTSHLESEFHKALFRHVGGKLPKTSADFLQEYLHHKNKKTEERCKTIKDLSTTIQQIFRDQDLTQELGMEHFVKKVEAAHCAACDSFVPMNVGALQRHVRSQLHSQNRRNMMDNAKKTALAVARSILDNKVISQKLDCYVKGQNPFIDDQTEVTASTSEDAVIDDVDTVNEDVDAAIEGVDAAIEGVDAAIEGMDEAIEGVDAAIEAQEPVTTGDSAYEEQDPLAVNATT